MADAIQERMVEIRRIALASMWERFLAASGDDEAKALYMILDLAGYATAQCRVPAVEATKIVATQAEVHLLLGEA